MKSSLRIFELRFMIVLALGGAPWAFGAEFHVSTAQQLQNALTVAASNGADDNIYLTNGYYQGNFNFKSTEPNNLTLSPEPGLTNTDITIDGGGVGSGLNISSSAILNTITVQGISFAINCGQVNPRAPLATLTIGAGSQATISVDGCDFFGTPTGAGNGLSVISGLNVIVKGIRISGAQSGGTDGLGDVFSGTGLLVGGNSYNAVSGNITVQDCEFSTNGFGVQIQGGRSIVISNNLFTGNLSAGLWMGGSALAQNGTLSVSQNRFYLNGWDPSEGLVGAYIFNCSTVTLTGNTLATNSLSKSTGGFGGGLVLAGNNAVTLIGNTFMGNLTSHRGGGVIVFNNGLPNTVLTITGNDFIGNSAFVGGAPVGSTAGAGGAVYVEEDAATVLVQANTFKQNASADVGGALYVSAPTVSIQANTFEKNASAGDGGAIYVSAPTVNISDNLVAGNART